LPRGGLRGCLQAPQPKELAAMSTLSPSLGLGLGLVMVLGGCVAGQGFSTSPDAAIVPAGSCAAGQHQDWVGQRVDVLNEVTLPEGTRVLFPTTPATMDFREDRMNVEVDKSDTITRVFCG
jgi:Peptidase inhibitor I78 family